MDLFLVTDGGAVFSRFGGPMKYALLVVDQNALVNTKASLGSLYPVAELL